MKKVVCLFAVAIAICVGACDEITTSKMSFTAKLYGADGSVREERPLAFGGEYLAPGGAIVAMDGGALTGTPTADYRIAGGGGLQTTHLIDIAVDGGDTKAGFVFLMSSVAGVYFGDPHIETYQNGTRDLFVPMGPTVTSCIVTVPNNNGDFMFSLIGPASSDNGLYVTLTVPVEDVHVGNPVHFRTEVSGGKPPYSFSWDFSGGLVYTTQEFTATFDETGWYYCTLTVTDGSGVTTVRGFSIEVVTPAPVTEGEGEGEGQSVIEGEGEGEGESSTNNIVVPNLAGLTQPQVVTTIGQTCLVLGTVSTVTSATVPAGQVISWSPTGSVPCGTAINIVISTGAGEGGPVLSGVVFPTGNLILNHGQDYTFECSEASGGKGPYTYFWMFGDGKSGSGRVVHHTYAANFTSDGMDIRCLIRDSKVGGDPDPPDLTLTAWITVN